MAFKFKANRSIVSKTNLLMMDDERARVIESIEQVDPEQARRIQKIIADYEILDKQFDERLSRIRSRSQKNN